MAAKGVNDLAAAKAKKQKKIAIGGSVLLVALLVFQVPRTMKMLNRQSAAPSEPAAASTTPAPATTPPAAASAVVATPATPTSSSAQLGADALVVTADLSPAPLEGQLVDLTAFSSKDPFAQKNVTPKGSGSGSGAGSVSGGDGSSKGSGGSLTTPGKGTGSGSDKGSGSSSGAKPAVPVPTSAQISVNGVEETVAKGSDFPVAAPLFHLVSLTANTAKISVAGGSLASGAGTVTLKLGKPLTLMNTADGSRYVIVLVSTSSAASGSGTPTTTTPATTTPAAPTTTTPTGG